MNQSRRTIRITQQELAKAEPRFWAAVDRRGDDECWPWTKAKHQGYGRISTGGRTNQKIMKSHRFAYELMVGPVPDGAILDHTCHDPEACDGGDECPHRGCCNPRHVTPTTSGVNGSSQRSVAGRLQKARTHCPRGHEYTEENTRTKLNNGYVKRYCITCMNTRRNNYQ